MPKKTRRAKLIAEYRRKLQHSDSVGAPSSSGQMTSAQHQTYSIPNVSAAKPTVHTPAVSMSPEALGAIKRDLLRTLGIVSIAIVCELVLWRYLG